MVCRWWSYHRKKAANIVLKFISFRNTSFGINAVCEFLWDHQRFFRLLRQLFRIAPVWIFHIESRLWHSVLYTFEYTLAILFRFLNTCGSKYCKPKFCPNRQFCTQNIIRRLFLQVKNHSSLHFTRIYKSGAPMINRLLICSFRISSFF